jgi:DNA-binding XRE family transcriptional regulator
MEEITTPSPEDVRSLRAELGLTQAKLAQVAHVTPRSIQMWESPTKTLSHRYPSPSAWAIVLHYARIRPLPTRRSR